MIYFLLKPMLLTLKLNQHGKYWSSFLDTKIFVKKDKLHYFRIFWHNVLWAALTSGMCMLTLFKQSPRLLIQLSMNVNELLHLHKIKSLLIHSFISTMIYFPRKELYSSQYVPYQKECISMCRNTYNMINGSIEYNTRMD